MSVLTCWRAGLALCSFLLVEKFSVKVLGLAHHVGHPAVRNGCALALITLLCCSFLLRAPLPRFCARYADHPGRADQVFLCDR
ncbi:MAG: hypothetical protein V8T10_01540 [Merdibacter sp.]